MLNDDSWPRSKSDYQLGAVIGEEATFAVYEAVCLSRNEKCAIKCISLDKFGYLAIDELNTEITVFFFFFKLSTVTISRPCPSVNIRISSIIMRVSCGRRALGRDETPEQRQYARYFKEENDRPGTGTIEIWHLRRGDNCHNFEGDTERIGIFSL